MRQPRLTSNDTIKNSENNNKHPQIFRRVATQHVYEEPEIRFERHHTRHEKQIVEQEHAPQWIRELHEMAA